MSLSENLINVVSKSAPVLGAALATPLAGIGISLLASLFGADPKNTDDLLERIQNDPNAAIKIKTLEFEHQEALEEIASTNFKNEVDDRKSARQLQADLSNNGNRDFVPSVLALGFLVIYTIIQVYVILMPGSENDVVSARVQDILIMIISFYFGGMHREKGHP